MEAGWLQIINPGDLDVALQFVAIGVAIGRNWWPIWLAVENIRSPTVRGLVVDDGIRMDGMIQRRELPWGDE